MINPLMVMYRKGAINIQGGPYVQDSRLRKTPLDLERAR